LFFNGFCWIGRQTDWSSGSPNAVLCGQGITPEGEDQSCKKVGLWTEKRGAKLMELRSRKKEPDPRVGIRLLANDSESGRRYRDDLSEMNPKHTVSSMRIKFLFQFFDGVGPMNRLGRSVAVSSKGPNRFLQRF
jgi:hypothetical protein